MTFPTAAHYAAITARAHADAREAALLQRAEELYARDDAAAEQADP